MEEHATKPLMQLKVTGTYCNGLLIHWICAKGQCCSMKWIGLVQSVNKRVNLSCICQTNTVAGILPLS